MCETSEHRLQDGRATKVAGRWCRSCCSCCKLQAVFCLIKGASFRHLCCDLGPVTVFILQIPPALAAVGELEADKEVCFPCSAPNVARHFTLVCTSLQAGKIFDLADPQMNKGVTVESFVAFIRQAAEGELRVYFDASTHRERQVAAFVEGIQSIQAVEGAISREEFVRAYREEICNKVGMFN
jgi:hypothetical protein